MMRIVVLSGIRLLISSIPARRRIVAIASVLALVYVPISAQMTWYFKILLSSYGLNLCHSLSLFESRLPRVLEDLLRINM